jgi:hypothetical protein
LDIVGEVQASLNDAAVQVTAEHDTIMVDLPKRQIGLIPHFPDAAAFWLRDRAILIGISER